jgi:hypothetical protein
MDLFWTVAFTAVPLFLSIFGSYKVGFKRGTTYGYNYGAGQVLKEWKKTINYDYDWQNDVNNVDDDVDISVKGRNYK